MQLALRAGLAARLAAALTLAAGIVALGPNGTARAETSAQTSYPVSVACTSADQFCEPPYNLLVTTSSALQAQFTASPTLCSSIKVYLVVDGVVRSASGFLGPGQGTGFVNLGPVGPGPHMLSLYAEGTPGGCNVGRLGAYEGTLDVITSSATPGGTGNNSGAGAQPTEKDQCKRDGWRSFTNPSFKNQGECIKFVKHQKGESGDDDEDDDDD